MAYELFSSVMREKMHIKIVFEALQTKKIAADKPFLCSSTCSDPS